MMGEFKRGLHGDAKWAALEKLAAGGDNWWRDLLSLWAPSGQEAGQHGLRLALRDGYINFYRQGQSIARVCFGQQRDGMVEARMDIHAKYVWDTTDLDAYAQIQGDTATCTGLATVPYSGLTTLQEWIKRSEGWTGQEKAGVDMIVGANTTVIDLEMAMPAWASKATALRVDMVALDVSSAEPQIVLWEAKPLNAPALRARTGDAEIVNQMAEYERYLATAEHRESLAKAYQTTCSALVKLADMARRNIALNATVKQVAEGEKLTVDPKPRLALFQGATWKEGAPTFERYAEGWPAHRDKLRAVGIVIAESNDPRHLRLGDVA